MHVKVLCKQEYATHITHILGALALSPSGKPKLRVLLTGAQRRFCSPLVVKAPHFQLRGPASQESRREDPGGKNKKTETKQKT